MDWYSVVADSNHQIRSGWKFLAYSALLVGLFVMTKQLVGGLVLWLYPAIIEIPPGDIRSLGLNAIVLFIPSAGALLMMGSVLDRIPLRAFGIGFHQRWLKDFGVGMGVAAVMVAATVAGSFLLGSARIEWSGSLAGIPVVALTLIVLALSAFNEELVFRGYPLQVLMRGLGPWPPWPSMILISSLFGLLHWRNPGATGLGIVNTVLAGFMLALAYLKTRSVWFPYGIHFAWNAGTSVLMGYPVSGLKTVSFIAIHVDGSSTLLGGGYGPEAGLLGTAVFAGAAIAVYRMGNMQVSPEVGAALAENSGKLYVGK